MFRSSKDDGQMFMMIVGMGARNDANNEGELANGLTGMVAIAIVLMVFVGLLKDLEQRRFQEQFAQPSVPTQPTQSVYLQPPIQPPMQRVYPPVEDARSF